MSDRSGAGAGAGVVLLWTGMGMIWEGTTPGLGPLIGAAAAKRPKEASEARTRVKRIAGVDVNERWWWW